MTHIWYHYHRVVVITIGAAYGGGLIMKKIHFACIRVVDTRQPFFFVDQDG